MKRTAPVLVLILVAGILPVIGSEGNAPSGSPATNAPAAELQTSASLPPLPTGVRVASPERNALHDALRPVPPTAIFKMEGYYLWDPSVIKVGDTWHLFASRWPASEGMKGWMHSHAIRATSRSLFGPYEFQGIVLSPTNHPWATQAIHNPKITRAGGRFLLYHLGIPRWQAGFAWADSIDGPWTPVPAPVIPANNPALWINPDVIAYAVGKFKIKPPAATDGHWDAYMNAFSAKAVGGPYLPVGDAGNRLPGNLELEDPTLWRTGGRYHVVCTDWEAKVTGVEKAMVYYTSADGLAYELHSRIPVWSQRDPVPLAGGGSFRVKGLERPQVCLDENGAVIALLASVYPYGQEPTYLVIRPVAVFRPSGKP